MPTPGSSPGEGQGDDLGDGVEVDARLVPRIVRAVVPARRGQPGREACWPCGHRDASWRTGRARRPRGQPGARGAHHGARTCDARGGATRARRPEGEKISRLPVPSRCRSVSSIPPSPGGPSSGCLGRPRWPCRRRTLSPRSWPGRQPGEVPSAPRRRRAHRRSASAGALLFGRDHRDRGSAPVAAAGRRRWSTRTGPGSPAPRPAWWPSSCATSARSRTSPRTRPPPCGSLASAGTGSRSPRSAWRRGRSSPAHRHCRARSPWPDGRCATCGRSHRGVA